MLFSLVLLQFLDSTSASEKCLLSLWYLDDGTFIGSRSALLDQVLACTLYYLNVSFTGLLEILAFIKRNDPMSSGLGLLGSPVWGPPQFFDSFLPTKLDKTSSIQEKLPESSSRIAFT